MTDREFNGSVRKIRPQLVAFASSFMCRGAAIAEDMVQDAVLKVWQQNGREEIIFNTDASSRYFIVELRLPDNGWNLHY